MNWPKSFGGGGAAYDVEPEQCRLVGTVFLGAIAISVNLKYEKKCTLERVEYEGMHKEGWREKKFQPFASAKKASLLRTRKFGPSPAAAKRALPRCTRRLPPRLVSLASPRQTRKYGHCVFAFHL